MGTPTSPPQPRPQEPAPRFGPIRRPGAVTLLAVLDFLGAPLMLLGASVLVVPPGTRGSDPLRCTAVSSLQAFALVAVPVQAGRTGIRSFCTDLSGRICVFADGSVPATQGGVCPPTCQVLP